MNGAVVDPGSGGVVDGLDAGTYTVEYIIHPACIIEVGTADIIEQSNFSADITPPSADVISGESVSLTLGIEGVIGEYTVDWSTIDNYTCLTEDAFGNCIEILLEASTDQQVHVAVSDEFGCFSDAVALIRAEVVRDVFVPNVFSPNGDAINDQFKPFAPDESILVNSFEIFNRWGELVYREEGESIASMVGWDGRYRGVNSPPGAYVYTLNVEGSDGFKQVLVGDVTVIR